MATAESVKDDHLTCSICYRPFAEPKTLQCLHTFCQECLQHHINHGNHIRGIPCPVCRHVTVPQDSFQPRQNWARLIKTDFKLAGILEALGQMEKGKRAHPDAIVVTGSPSHFNDRKSQLTTMLQVLRPAVNFIQVKIDTEKEGIKTMGDTRAETKRDIKAYVEKLIEDIKQKENILIKDLNSSYEMKKTESEENVKRFQKLVEETQDTIGLIDRLLSPGSEYATMECLPRIQKQQEDVMKFVTDPPVDECPVLFSFHGNITHVKSLMSSLELGSVWSNSESDDMYAVGGQETRKNVLHQEKVVSATAMQRYNVPNKQEPSEQEASSDNGADPPSSLPDPPRTVEVPPEQPSDPSYVLERTINTKLDEDNYDPELRNIVILQGKTSPVIIILDYDNGSLKSFYEVDGQPKSNSHRFSGYPQSIAKLSEERVIVSLMNYKFFVFTSDLKQVSSIESEKWYTCMTTVTTQEKLLGFVNTTTTTIIGGRHTVLDHLTVKGKPSNKFINTAPAEGMFGEVSHLCSTPNNNIIVSDCTKHDVTCISMEGSLLWRVEPRDQELACPVGVACDSRGDVFVVDKDKKCIVKISGDQGQVLGDVVTRDAGLENPIALALDTADKIYVIQTNGEIRVFSL
ncbi:tripartite motif-containing protein 2-like [Haliotis cracherodii]|uniref:tripartite motif-containing protein 2-like n=1 Tax=Haliotis cracherodii TaxID=6455 RepID=UPI0039ED6FCF